MTYQFELDVTTTIDAQTVEKIVSNLVEERTSKKVAKILTKSTDGKFDGFEIHFITEIAEPNAKKDNLLDKSFKVFKWDQ